MNTLKEFNNDTKGYSLKYKIYEFYWALRYAWQRAWRGYDDRDVFNCDYRFLERMLLILRDFKKYNVADWTYLAKDTPLKTDEILDRMIYLLENCSPEAWADSEEEPFKNFDCLNIEHMAKVREFENKALDNQKEFLELFVKYFHNLWF